MPRHNRAASRSDDEDDALGRLLVGVARTEVRRGLAWRVQPISAPRALKRYVCPSCGGDIEPGVAHVVAWRADGVLGDDAALADRRHWHLRCWRIG